MARRKNTAEAYEILFRIAQKKKAEAGHPPGRQTPGEFRPGRETVAGGGESAIRRGADPVGAGKGGASWPSRFSVRPPWKSAEESAVRISAAAEDDEEDEIDEFDEVDEVAIRAGRVPVNVSEYAAEYAAEYAVEREPQPEDATTEGAEGPVAATRRPSRKRSGESTLGKRSRKRRTRPRGDLLVTRRDAWKDPPPARP